jgi:hypothetical protein
MLKNKKLTKKELCDKWLINKNINPETSRKIKENGEVYKKLEKLCSLNQNKKQKKDVKITQKDLCDKWLTNKTVNPETSRKIKENGEVYKKLEKLCSVKSLKSSSSFKTAPLISSSKSKYQSFSQSTPKLRTKTTSNIDKDIQQIQKENREIEDKLRQLIKKNKQFKNSSEIKKDIGKYIKPLMRINRMTTIQNRIKYYRILHKYIESRKKYQDNCLRLYKYTDSGGYIYRIGNRIILDKQIGSNSKWGSVFLSHYRLNNKKFGKLFTFATKISDGSAYNNQNEYKVLKDLTDFVLREECPHFPITFGKLECKTQNIRDSTNQYLTDKSQSFKNQSSSSFKELLETLPKNIINKPYIMTIMSELAENDANNFIKFYHSNDKIIWNALVQIMLSIMFFHKYTNAHHRDAHCGNFLYHKITPGGYFHYNLYGTDFYLENIGFLWVIWDFGLMQPFSNSKLINNNKYGYGDPTLLITKDYLRIIDTAFILKKDGGAVSDKYKFGRDITEFIFILYDEFFKPKFINTTDINLLKDLDMEIIRILVNYSDKYNTFKTELYTDEDVINVNKPYIL